MCESRSESIISQTLLQVIELKVAQAKEPDTDFCLGLPGWCPCLLCSPPASLVIDKGKDKGVNTGVKINHKNNNKTHSRPSLKATKADEHCKFDVPDRPVMHERKPLRLKCKQGDKNIGSSEASKVEDRFSFDIDEENLMEFKHGEVPPNTAKTQIGFFETLKPSGSPKTKNV